MSSLKDFCKVLGVPHGDHSNDVEELYELLKEAPSQIKPKLEKKVRSLANSLKVVDEGEDHSCVRLLRFSKYDYAFYLERVDESDPFYFGMDVDEVAAMKPKRPALCVPVSALLDYVSSVVQDPVSWMEVTADRERDKRNAKLLGKHVYEKILHRRYRAKDTVRNRNEARNEARHLEEKARYLESALRHFTSLDESARKKYEVEKNALRQEAARLRLRATVPVRKARKEESPRGVTDYLFGWKESRSRSRSRRRSRSRTRGRRSRSRARGRRSRSESRDRRQKKTNNRRSKSRRR